MSQKLPPGSYQKGQYPAQYPTQQGYPTQAYMQYGMQQQQPYMQQQQQMPLQHHQPAPTYGYPQQSSMQQSYGVPPPPYTDAAQTMARTSVPPASYSSYPTQAQPVTSGYSSYPTAYPQMNVPNPIPTGAFDPGARFGAGATMNIPPAPPGVMPTHAQMAAAQGQPVAMQQRPANWFSGGSDGGSTFW